MTVISGSAAAAAASFQDKICDKDDDEKSWNYLIGTAAKTFKEISRLS